MTRLDVLLTSDRLLGRHLVINGVRWRVVFYKPGDRIHAHNLSNRKVTGHFKLRELAELLDAGELTIE